MLYEVVGWAKHYESSKTRETKTMQWLALPVNLTGDGYTLTIENSNGPALYGAWCAIIQVAARCASRGKLLRSNGKPHDAESLSRKTRIDEPLIQEALEWFCSDDMRWLRTVPYKDPNKTPQIPGRDPDDTLAIPLQDRTGHNKTRQKKDQKNPPGDGSIDDAESEAEQRPGYDICGQLISVSFFEKIKAEYKLSPRDTMLRFFRARKSRDVKAKVVVGMKKGYLNEADPLEDDAPKEVRKWVNARLFGPSESEAE